MLKKQKIPKALREQVWIKIFGKTFESKCYINWCQSNINVFNFHVCHNIPESKGGLTIIENLFPCCANCNLSMSNKYTIDEWNKFSSKNNSQSKSTNTGLGKFNWYYKDRCCTIQ